MTVKSNQVWQRRSGKLKPYLFLLPILLFAVGFVYYPFIRTFMYSFSTVNRKGEIIDFVGLNNFKYLFGNQTFHIALKNTLLLTVVTVPIILLFSLFLALLASKPRKLSSVYETMFTLPMAVSMPAACMVFKLLLNPQIGIVNYLLQSNYLWFQGTSSALIGIVAISVWVGVPFDFLLMLSAVRNVPTQLSEAAQIDGAGYFRRLFSVTLPLITPTILYILLTNTVLSMMTSAPIILITEGGPARSTTTLIYMMFTSGYQSSNYSMASCISITTFLLTFGFVALSMYFERKKVHYQ